MKAVAAARGSGIASSPMSCQLVMAPVELVGPPVPPGEGRLEVEKRATPTRVRPAPTGGRSTELRYGQEWAQ